MMPWKYEVHPTLGIVEVTYTGRVSGQDIHDLTSELLALEKEQGKIGFLVDTTNMEFTGSLFDIYELPAKQYVEEEADRLNPIAVILSTSPKEKKTAKFYELVCLNRGWIAKSFEERQDATNWLTHQLKGLE